VPSRERTEDVTQDRMTTLFFEIMSSLPRQGPGNATCTRHALEAVPNVGPQTRLLDIGCGTGSQTRALLEHSLARVLAIDNHLPFIEELNRQARRLGLADRLEARVADMRELTSRPPRSTWCGARARSTSLASRQGSANGAGFSCRAGIWRSLRCAGRHPIRHRNAWSSGTRSIRLFAPSRVAPRHRYMQLRLHCAVSNAAIGVVGRLLPAAATERHRVVSATGARRMPSRWPTACSERSTSGGSMESSTRTSSS